ncbi:ATP-grasp domain-containing protein [Methanococcoides methylutens]|uniref:COG1821 family protein n=1 Tax=Methanococcoides methylutens MM1 TaxID=1434104 RepID=A0A0E3SRY1_METMT|nr:ATP-grasp domain-containing protein [Methanococcoides methylutens]AKB85052.1 COG1821 family protein [Methanococcoides methylutens MM1]
MHTGYKEATLLENVLVLGYSSRNIACSATRAGYNVYAIDAFCDMDLKENTVDCQSLLTDEDIDIKDIDRKTILKLIDNFDVYPDAIVLGSGFEELDLSDQSCRILNNSPDVMKKASDKSSLAKELESLGIPHPVSVNVDEAAEIGYPLMVKPKCAGGGRLNRVAYNEDDLNAILEELPEVDPTLSSADIMVQEFLYGFPASVSLIADGSSAVPIAANEQLIGIPWLSGLPFAYCGNITPYRTPYTEQMYEISERIASEFGLVGSNGVDFLLTDSGPVVIEVNARLQGSLDSVEMATGLNLFDLHVKAFGGILPENVPEIDQYAIRAVVYADNEITVDSSFYEKMDGEPIADIPEGGYQALPDDPITSVLATGKTREDVIEKVINVTRKIRELH